MLAEFGKQLLSFAIDIALTTFWLCSAVVAISFTVKITLGILADIHKKLKKLSDYQNRSDLK